MESILTLLLSTVILRPYVFIFLFVYLLGCSLHLGVKRTLLFAVAGYLVTWLSEYSSIHNGFPYGTYYYIEQTKGSELWVFGVPFMDSLSYVFLAYASYSMALLTLSPLRVSNGIVYLLETRAIRNSLLTRVLGTIFLVYLDIIIDPVALQGNRWFLGQIYGYPAEGAYFGVPISNFAGWFLVGFILLLVLQKIDYYMSIGKIKDHAGYHYKWRHLIGPALYVGILIFNLSVTFYIGEYTMGWAGVFIIALPLSLLFIASKKKVSRPENQNEMADHLRDFPEAVI
ncbi:MAG TPA: carotenoid biosynthesis protein [Dissulfurispiraceae bacterium]|nr:carotenoid biosynthesis protein [Dissulfurispiraceae bacterium]